MQMRGTWEVLSSLLRPQLRNQAGNRGWLRNNAQIYHRRCWCRIVAPPSRRSRNSVPLPMQHRIASRVVDTPPAYSDTTRLIKSFPSAPRRGAVARGSEEPANVGCSGHRVLKARWMTGPICLRGCVASSICVASKRIRSNSGEFNVNQPSNGSEPWPARASPARARHTSS